MDKGKREGTNVVAGNTVQPHGPGCTGTVTAAQIGDAKQNPVHTEADQSAKQQGQIKPVGAETGYYGGGKGDIQHNFG